MDSLAFWHGLPPAKGRYPGFKPHTVRTQGIRSDYDVAVTMRDGVEIYVDVFRPEREGRYPVLIDWAPYGKHGRIKYKYFPHCGVCDDDLSPFAVFEAADPAYWCLHRYIVINPDPRGAWGSAGDLTLASPQEAEDCYDLVEWAGSQDFSNGKVGMHGVSYLAWIQWKVAALSPPHLAAINPWEGVSDFYRELAFHGGIPETAFLTMWQPSVSFTQTRAEDMVRMAKEHPLFDAYWQSKNADLSKITVPAFVVASWSDHGLHARGTLEAFQRIASEDKWLLVHGRKKWQHFYENVERQRQFFDRFLQGKESEVRHWPRVMIEVRERYFVGNLRAEREWPLAHTRYEKLYLRSDGTLGGSLAQEGAVRYAVGGRTGEAQRTQFEYAFSKRIELTGHMKLRLWVEAVGGDDMDLFVAIQKVDRSGEIVPFPFFSNHEDGPVALGWLRVSHRELDEEKSTPYRPYLTHRSEQKLAAGEVVPVEIEIWPSSTLFEAGERLLIVVQGSDIYAYPEEMNTPGHAATVNRGAHVIHTGGKYNSHLLVPVIPAG